jgi:hypothetical protein
MSTRITFSGPMHLDSQNYEPDYMTLATKLGSRLADEPDILSRAWCLHYSSLPLIRRRNIRSNCSSWRLQANIGCFTIDDERKTVHVWHISQTSTDYILYKRVATKHIESCSPSCHLYSLRRSAIFSLRKPFDEHIRHIRLFIAL